MLFFDMFLKLMQENSINYRASAPAKDEVKWMNLLARAADSIASGDIINVQIRRYRQCSLKVVLLHLL